MGHNVSDRKLREIAAADRFARELREAPARRREIAFAGKVVDIWNSRLGRGAEMFFSPTLGGAILGGHPWLSFYCPGCQTVGEIDLRKVDRHHPRVIDWPRRASVYSGEMLVGQLNEMACIPNAGRWTWAISGTRSNPLHFTWKGEAETLDIASAQLAAAWAEWIDWAGLEQKEPLRRGKAVYSLC